MKLIRDLSNNIFPLGCVLTIGNFDGVHLGHQALLKQTKRLSGQYQLPSVLMSFYPIPTAFFGKPTAQINSFKEQFYLIEQQGLDTYLLCRFNQKFTELSAKNFIEKILIKQLNVNHLVIGDDFKFGKNQLGNNDLLNQYHSNFSTHQINAVYQDNQRISSSNIRKQLKQNNFAEAKKFLGRQFSITGKVIYGNQLGSIIGFPTLNIPLKRKKSPILGVFCVEIKIDNKIYQGVASIGNKPTIEGKKIQLEVFVFDFNHNIYGKIVQIFFERKIRDEQKFDDIKQLTQHIQNDVQSAKQYFSTQKTQ